MVTPQLNIMHLEKNLEYNWIHSGKSLVVSRAIQYIKTGAWVETRAHHGQMVQRLARLAHNQHDQGSIPCLPTSG